MKYIMQKLKVVVVGVLLAIYMATPAIADDIEIYTSLNAGDIIAQPNIMFILDSSGSMDTAVRTTTPLEPFDPTETYTGDCDADTIYYTSSGDVPDCSSSAYFDYSAALKCFDSVVRYDPDDGSVIPGPLLSAGYYTGQLAQYSPAVTTGNPSGRHGGGWSSISTSSNSDREKPIECYMDRGIHGETTGSGAKYIIDTDEWTSTVTPDSHLVWGSGANNYTLYHFNYLNYLSSAAPAAGDPPTRFDELKTAIIGLTDANTNINIGLMRFDSSDYEGGAVMYPIFDIGGARGDFQSRVNTMNADGGTPLAETYFEALRYFGGGAVYYGNDANPSNQTGTTETGTGNEYYQTPITDTCQKNYIIYLTDGTPTYDHMSIDQLETLTGFTETSCADTRTNSASKIADSCLVHMAEWAKDHDVATREYDAHDGEQHVKTYTIGFDLDAGASAGAAAIDLLERTAAAGGGEFYTARDSATLTATFNKIISEVLAVNSTFSSPAVSVNAFNRATNLEDLYFTLFKPAPGAHWEGNLKKFKLEFDSDRLPVVADANSNAAIDPITGFFKSSSVSYWTDSADAPDGAETAIGGAASHISRSGNKYTFAGSYTSSNGVLTPSVGDLTNASNERISGNANITDAMMGGFTDYGNVDYFDNGTVVTVPYRDALFLWSLGYDINDIDGDQNAVEDSRIMGDPLHAEPGLVQYGVLSGDVADLVAYVATNDGYLHAINTQDGSELFNFVPQELLPKLQDIYSSVDTSGKAYGLDGNVVSWINDVNRDGTISGAGEHVYIYFGMRRGGRYLYSMDVTDRNSPTLRWVLEGGTGDYAEMGQTWSAPNVEKIKMNGVDKTVLIFGAGYDVGQDALVQRGTDSVGRGIFIVDADTGELLWRAGPDAQADLTLSAMEYSIPARIKPIDIDGDSYVDRLYAGDMGGQLWRIDIDNNASTSSTVATTGVVFAELASDGSTANNRRFYNPPDAALILEEGKAPYVAVVAASGYRAHPLQTTTHDRSYMIRDNDVYQAIEPSTYTTVTESDLFDTTDNTIGEGGQNDIDIAKVDLNDAKGWYITFSEMGGSFVGEKALSEPLILNGVAIFTTFIPASAGLAGNSCTTNDGTGAIYFVNTVDGTPTGDNTGDSNLTREDRRVLLARGGIPPTPRVIITSDGVPTLCVGTMCSKAGEVGTVQKMYWYEVEE